MRRLPPVVRILERLARLPTTSFHEEQVALEAAKAAQSVGARVRRDQYGNLVLSPPRRRKDPPIWLVSHMNHPGLEMTGRREARLLGGWASAYFRRGTRFCFDHDGDAASRTRLLGYVRRFGPRLQKTGGRRSETPLRPLPILT